MLCQTLSSRWPSVLKHPMRLMHVFLPVFSKFEHELLLRIMQAWASPPSDCKDAFLIGSKKGKRGNSNAVVSDGLFAGVHKAHCRTTRNQINVCASYPKRNSTCHPLTFCLRTNLSRWSAWRTWNNCVSLPQPGPGVSPGAVPFQGELGPVLHGISLSKLHAIAGDDIFMLQYQRVQQARCRAENTK